LGIEDADSDLISYMKKSAFLSNYFYRFMDSTQLSHRTKSFALAAIRFFQICLNRMKHEFLEAIVTVCYLGGSQLPAANRSRSKQEFYAKLCIVVEECDESLFWMELLPNRYCQQQSGRSADEETVELLRIFSASRRTAKNGL